MEHNAKRYATGVLILTLLVTGASAVSFPDVDENAAYAEAVEYVSEAGIMEGKNGGNFDPEGTVTRAEMAAITCRLLGAEELDNSQEIFPDVPAGHWANVYVAMAAELGIVKGYTNGNFGPSDTVTYEQAVTMVVRCTGFDVDAIEAGGYPNGYLKTAGEIGLLDGVTSSMGAGFNRGQVATLVYNLIG